MRQRSSFTPRTNRANLHHTLSCYKHISNTSTQSKRETPNIFPHFHIIPTLPLRSPQRNRPNTMQPTNRLKHPILRTFPSLPHSPTRSVPSLSPTCSVPSPGIPSPPLILVPISVPHLLTFPDSVLSNRATNSTLLGISYVERHSDIRLSNPSVAKGSDSIRNTTRCPNFSSASEVK